MTVIHAQNNPEGAGPRSADAGALVMRVLRSRSGGAVSTFLLERAERDLAALPKGAERSALRRILAELRSEAPCEARLAGALAVWASAIEPARRFPEGDEAMREALALAPRSAELVLHAARIARKLGDGDRARRLYQRALELDGAAGPIGQMARIGHALLAEEAERELGRAARAAVRCGDAEAAGVALEERARLRREAGDMRAAARDLAMAVLRYPDALDRGRAAHRLADLAVTGGDPLAAREALLVALDVGDEGQREHARVRLHSISRDLGDAVGQRRWRSSAKPALVSMGLSRRRSPATAAPRLSRLRGLLDSSER